MIGASLSWRVARRAAAACGSAVLIAVLITGCGDDEPTTIRVPADEPTIQAAVDRATPGDLVLVDPGTYREQVIVETDDVVIRGTDRNEVVLDGGDELFDGFLVVSDGVAIENLTVTRYVQNGVIFTGQAGYSSGDDVAPDDPLQRYRVSHVTAVNNGTYGIYAFAARSGLIRDSYASGHPDSGFYVGQCKPCDVVLDNVTAERNSIGYFGTNASGGVFVINSTFRNNRLGLTPNSQLVERLSPQVGAVIAGNLVVDNDDPNAPAIAEGFFGGGIAIGGGVDNLVLRNRVEGHDGFGIGLLPLDGFAATGNRIEGNVVADNGIDLVLDHVPAPDGDGRGDGNCFVDNVFATAQPGGVTDALACDGEPGAVAPVAFVPPSAPPDVDYRTVPSPGPQPSMPDPRDVAAVPAGPPPAIDLDAIDVPTG